jgi:hypothetical protein
VVTYCGEARGGCGRGGAGRRAGAAAGVLAACGLDCVADPARGAQVVWGGASRWWLPWSLPRPTGRAWYVEECDGKGGLLEGPGDISEGGAGGLSGGVCVCVCVCVCYNVDKEQ